MARMEKSLDNGQTWSPVGVMRTTPGGLDVGQSDRSSTGKVALGGSPVTVQLGTPGLTKTWLLTDIFFQLDASTAAVAIQSGGVTVWQAVAGTAPRGQGRRRPISLPGGAAVTVVYGAAAAGTPNAYHNLGILEQ